jgi:hypothetical protein
MNWHQWRKRLKALDTWRQDALAQFPARWRSRIERAVREIEARGPTVSPEGAYYSAEATANGFISDARERLMSKLPASATDSDLIDAADKASRAAREINSLPVPVAARRAIIGRYCSRWRVSAPGERVDDHPAIARMMCAHWWRRQLRRLHAREVEVLAIRLGYVHARAERYLSDESFSRRVQQCRRNRRMLEATQALNESTGEVATLAELADRTVSKPENRRGELMTRIKGFEEVAAQRGDAALFITATAPSAYHPVLAVAGRYNDASPNETQRYMCAWWARARAALHRGNVRPYGFRIAEPHADGCPHWHLLLFVAADQANALEATIKRHALAEAGDERGAQAHRCKVVNLDPARGGASAYVAKYVSKGIGLDVGDGDAARVPAWAASHQVRQFQQIGGPPVTLWRELRRVSGQAVEGSSQVLCDAWRACQREGERLASWKDFCLALGGPTVRRAELPLRVAREQSASINRYGEAGALRPVGVVDANNARVFSERGRWRVLPWTRVNNCTGPGPWAKWARAIPTQLMELSSCLLTPQQQPTVRLQI